MLDAPPAPGDPPPAPGDPPPAELPVALVPATRVLAGGRVLLGGSPARLISLTDAGARVLAGWRKPAPVGSSTAARRLARRLLDAGILAPRPAAVRSTSELTVVVPVRDRPGQLGRCLDAIAMACRDSPVFVVDDGSAAPAPVHRACQTRGVRVLRHAVCRGPAAARNTGLAACTTPYVAFVDSDVVLPAASVRGLLGHLVDPCLGAVAPRVRPLAPGGERVARYEQRHSALDMGPAGALVAPGRAVSYVPSTVLVVRRAAAGRGFDESLRTGEDVDFVWRLLRAGWRVRYAPEIAVWHEHRVRLRAFVADRHTYARSAGRLARRHPAALPAVWLNPGLAAVWVLALAGRPKAALGAATWAGVSQVRKLSRRRGLPGGLAGLVVARGLVGSGLALAHAVRRWSPALLALALRRPGIRAGLVAAFAVPVIEDGLRSRDPAAALADAPLRLLDEVLAATGTWDGCVRERTLRPLLPARRAPNLTAA